MKNWLVVLIVSLISYAGVCETPSLELKAGTPAPYTGVLLTEERAAEGAAVLIEYNDTITALEICQGELRLERNKRPPFWRRPTVWLPVVALAFVAGWATGGGK